MKRILFVLKDRLYSQAKTSYGLINSASLVAEFLKEHKYDCKVVSVIDSNFIDKEVHEFKPDIVIIEAIWVPTYKLKELLHLKRHKHIQWIIRVHSDIGFLSVETQALKLINEYIDLYNHNLKIALNSSKFVIALSDVLKYKFGYLPNIVTIKEPILDFLDSRKYIDIGCFGAMRILKNQCFQAICSIQAADYLGKELRFHITPNLGIENDPVLANLIELFRNSKHELIIHDWLPNVEFQKLVRQMDLGIQLSFTESFNIISADFINNNRLVIASNAIDWLPPIVRVSTTDYIKATRKIIYAYKLRNSLWLKTFEREYLIDFNNKTKREWLGFLNKKK